MTGWEQKYNISIDIYNIDAIKKLLFYIINIEGRSSIEKTTLSFHQKYYKKRLSYSAIIITTRFQSFCCERLHLGTLAVHTQSVCTDAVPVNQFVGHHACTFFGKLGIDLCTSRSLSHTGDGRL